MGNKKEIVSILTPEVIMDTAKKILPFADWRFGLDGAPYTYLTGIGWIKLYPRLRTSMRVVMGAESHNSGGPAMTVRIVRRQLRATYDAIGHDMGMPRAREYAEKIDKAVADLTAISKTLHDVAQTSTLMCPDDPGYVDYRIPLPVRSPTAGKEVVPGVYEDGEDNE